MSILKRGSLKAALDFNCGLHTVKLVDFGERESYLRVFDNGESKVYKATVWFKLEDDKHAVDKHIFYYDTVAILNPETQKNEPTITEDDAEKLLSIVNNIRKQIDDKALEAITDFTEILEYLKDNKCTFQTFVSETPSQDGSKMWKNFDYNPDTIKISTIKK